MIQPQIEPKKFLISMGHADAAIDFAALLANAGGFDTDMPGVGADGMRPSVIGGMAVNQLAQGDERGRTQGTIADLDLFRDYMHKRGVDPGDLDLEQMAIMAGRGDDD